MLSLKKISSPQGFCKVELRSKLTELSFNVLMRMVAGIRYFSCSEKGDKFRKVIKDVFEVAQAENPQDFLPFLQWIDYGGFRKKLACLAKEVDEFLQRLVDEHRHDHKRNTMIGHLLGLQESQLQFYSDETIKATIMLWRFQQPWQPPNYPCAYPVRFLLQLHHQLTSDYTSRLPFSYCLSTEVFV
ncbi:hypothetical protein ACS0TY_029353 [Phlomoides rotata]